MERAFEPVHFSNGFRVTRTYVRVARNYRPRDTMTRARATFTVVVTATASVRIQNYAHSRHGTMLRATLGVPLATSRYGINDGVIGRAFPPESTGR